MVNMYVIGLLIRLSWVRPPHVPPKWLYETSTYRDVGAFFMSKSIKPTTFILLMDQILQERMICGYQVQASWVTLSAACHPKPHPYHPTPHQLPMRFKHDTDRHWRNTQQITQDDSDSATRRNGADSARTQRCPRTDHFASTTAWFDGRTHQLCTECSATQRKNSCA